MFNYDKYEIKRRTRKRPFVTGLLDCRITTTVQRMNHRLTNLAAVPLTAGLPLTSRQQLLLSVYETSGENRKLELATMSGKSYTSELFLLSVIETPINYTLVLTFDSYIGLA